MEDQNWTIGKVIDISDSQYGKKVRFYLNGYDDEVSCFTKWPEKMTEGAEIFGHVEVKGQYRNFKWGKKSTTQTPAGGSFTDFDRELMKEIFNQVNIIRKHLTLGADPYDKTVDESIAAADMPF